MVCVRTAGDCSESSLIAARVRCSCLRRGIRHSSNSIRRLRRISYSSNGITPGAGKTYIKAGSHQPRLTVESMAADGITVAEHLRNELHWPKITLIGQSICCAKTCD
jgi:hypothetical protein